MQQKTLGYGSIAMCLVLLVGTLAAPDSVMMWLASDSIAMELARVALLGLFVILLIAPPIRQPRLRSLLSLIMAGSFGWAVARCLSGSVQLFDAVLLLQAGLLCALALLTAEPLPAEQPQPVAQAPLAAKTGISLQLRWLISSTTLATLARRQRQSLLNDWSVLNQTLRGQASTGHSP
jgi:hypothetical protein